MVNGKQVSNCPGQRIMTHNEPAVVAISKYRQLHSEPKMPPLFDAELFTHFVCFEISGSLRAVGEAAHVEQLDEGTWLAFAFMWEFGPGDKWYPACHPGCLLEQEFDNGLIRLVSKQEFFAACLQDTIKT